MAETRSCYGDMDHAWEKCPMGFACRCGKTICGRCGIKKEDDNA